MSDSDSDFEDETLENVLQNYGEDTTELVLVRRGIIGTIPPVLGNLTNLVKLNLDDNKLTGTIPPELGKLTNLMMLNLDENSLEGPIPPELGKLINLTALHIEGNELTGHIPPELGQLTNLKELLLFHNQLGGPIPPSLGNLINLENLILHNNKLTGVIPGTLSKLTKLVGLTLQGNEVTEVEHGTIKVDQVEGQKEFSELLNRALTKTYGLKAALNANPPLPEAVVKYNIVKYFFGKIIKPYKKHLSRVDDKGAYFNTRFGVQKLRDDERGLYLKNGKGVRLYLYKWN